MDYPQFFAHLEELFEADEGSITSATVLKEIPGWSSLTFVGLIAMIDEEYGVSVPPSTILSSRTVGDLANAVGGGSQARAA